jgi:exonuclease SbcC
VLPGAAGVGAGGRGRGAGGVERLPVVEARRAVLAHRPHGGGRARRVHGRLEQLREEHVLARETLVSLREKEHDLREARFISMVAELAGRLEDGSPCEVCGATSHPDPYLGDGESVTRDDEDRARIAAEHAARRSPTSRRGSPPRPPPPTATAIGCRDRHADDDLEPLWAAVQAELAALRTRRGHADRLHRGARAARRRAGAAEAAAARLEGEVTARAAGAEAQARASAHAARLHAELDGRPTSLRRWPRARRWRRPATRCGPRAESGSRDREASAARCARVGLHRAGFADVAAARAALRPAAWRERADRRCRAHDDERAAVEAVLAEPELLDLSRSRRTSPERRRRCRPRTRGCGRRPVRRRRRLPGCVRWRTLVPALVAAQEALVPLEERAGTFGGWPTCAPAGAPTR